MDAESKPKRIPGKPFEKGDPRAGRPKGVQNKATVEIREASKRLLEDDAYQANLLERLRDGKAPHMETLLHHYAYGKPKETHELTGKDGGPIQTAAIYDGLTTGELATRLHELAEKARQG